MAEFLYEYFCRPVVEHAGYNIVNTLVYGAILLAVAFFVVYPLLHRRGIRFNFGFMLALLPYVLFGATFRVLEDLALLPRSCNPLELGFFTYTPGIYIATFALVIISLIVAKLVAKKSGKDFNTIFGAIGVVLVLPLIGFHFLQFRAWEGFLAVVAGTATITAAVYYLVPRLHKNLKGFFKDGLNTLAVGAQALDGTATFVATQFYRCSEQHLLSDAIIGVQPLLFIFVKIALILAILYYVDAEIKNENLRGFIKVFLVILGFATGLRDVFTLGVGTCL